MWDLTGSSVFFSILHTYIDASRVLLLCYSCESRESFTEMKNMYKKIIQSGLINSDKRIIVVATKIDSSNKIEGYQSWGIEFCKKNGFVYLSVSSKNNVGISELKREIVIDADQLHTIPLDIDEINYERVSRMCCYNCKIM